MRSVGTLLLLLLASTGIRADALCDDIDTVLRNFASGLTSPEVRGTLVLRDDDTDIYASPLEPLGFRCAVHESARRLTFHCSQHDAAADAQPRLVEALAACPLQWRGERESWRDGRGDRVTRLEVIAPPRVMQFRVSEWGKTRRRVSLAITPAQ